MCYWLTSGIVVGGVLLAGDELLGVEKLAVGPRAHLVHHRRLQVHKNRARYVLTPGQHNSF